MSIEDDIRGMIEVKRRENELALEQQRQQQAARELAAIDFARKLNQVLRDTVIVTLARASNELQAQRLSANIAYTLVVSTDLVDDMTLTFYDPGRPTKRAFIRYRGNQQRHVVYVETGSLPVHHTDHYKTFKKVGLDDITTTMVEQHVKAFIKAVIRLNEII